MLIKTSGTNGAGYEFNDNRASGGGLVENDMYSCTHCQALIRVAQWRQDGGFCGQCHAPICGPCADKMLTHGCEPFVAQIEKSMGLRYKLEQFRKLAGIERNAPTEGTRIIIGGV